ncbi:hypothetical protein, partial [Ruoffia tabacinasalis]
SNSYHLYISGDSLRMKTGSAGSDETGSAKRDLPGSGNRVFMVFLERYMHYTQKRLLSGLEARIGCLEGHIWFKNRGGLDWQMANGK